MAGGKSRQNRGSSGAWRRKPAAAAQRSGKPKKMKNGKNRGAL